MVVRCAPSYVSRARGRVMAIPGVNECGAMSANRVGYFFRCFAAGRDDVEGNDDGTDEEYL